MSLDDSIKTRHLRFDGLQIHSNESLSGPGNGIYLQHHKLPSEYIVTNNVIKRSVEKQGDGIRMDSYSGAELIAVNNITYNFNIGINARSTSVTDLGSDYYIYNNTSYGNSYDGFHINAYGSTNNISAKNNLSQGNGRYDFYVESLIENPDHSNNLSEDGTAIGTAIQTNNAADLIAPVAGDFRIGLNDTFARANGVNLSADIIYPFNIDIMGATRDASWDIGAIADIDFSGLTLFDELGSGTASDPYQIFNVTQFEDFTDDTVDGCNSSTATGCAHHFSINNDLDLSTFVTAPYIPIGDSVNPYTGTFEGNGRTISNLTLTG